MLVLIEGYALLLVLQAFGFKINLPFIVFLLLALCCLYLAIVAREGRLKVFEQWSNDEEKNKKRGFLLFLLLALALFLFSVVSLLTSISPGFVIIPVLIVLIAFMIEEVISLKKAA